MLSAFPFGQVWVPYTDVNTVAVCGVHVIPVAPFSSMNEDSALSVWWSRRVLLVSQPGLRENCYQEDLSNLPPALVFISSSVTWERPWVSKTFFECQIFRVWRWQWIIGRPKTDPGLLGLSRCLLHCNALSSSFNAHCFMLAVWRLILKFFSSGDVYFSLFHRQFPGSDCVNVFLCPFTINMRVVVKLLFLA